MEIKARKIQIHIRTPRKVVDTHAHKKAKVHKHAHEHDKTRAELALAKAAKLELERKEAERILAEQELLRQKEDERLELVKRAKEEAKQFAQKLKREAEESRLRVLQEEKEKEEYLKQIATEKAEVLRLRHEEEKIIAETEKHKQESKEAARRQFEIEMRIKLEEEKEEQMRKELAALQKRTEEILSLQAQSVEAAHVPRVVQPDPQPPTVSAPRGFAIPKKPAVVEGITVSTLSVAYFCMEMSIDESIPTFAGGLGILAGDMLRSSSDLGLEIIGISLLYRKGYFQQRFDNSGWQVEEDERWDPLTKLILLPELVEVELEGRNVVVRAWLYKVVGVGGQINPLIFLDTDFAPNTAADREITSRLYMGDRAHRLKQEAILGVAGFRMLQKIGATNIQKFHMNEGHSSLMTLELFRKYATSENPVEEVRQRAVFTTHTPVAAGHDVFTKEVVLHILGKNFFPKEIEQSVLVDGELNMTHLGLEYSGYINGVAKKHGEVARELFPGYHIESITNGVRVKSWVTPEIAELYDRYIPGWQKDAYNLRYALLIPAEELWSAHQSAKLRLCNHINSSELGAGFDPNVFTIGFARRATSYKRGNLLFRDIERLKYLAAKHGGIQIVYSGKAHPDDRDSKLEIQRIINEMRSLSGSSIRAVYLPNYNASLTKLLVSGVDIWLNTPLRPLEASGTSGMKAALNGIPQFSTLDGWWLEGHIENVTGWSIGPHPETSSGPGSDAEDTEDLYAKLEHVILPKYAGDKHSWIKMMRSSIAINGSFFNTQRMVEQYVLSAYFK